jgi:hypothetical protein
METDDADFGGGIVEIKGTIRNCTNAVRFGRYRDGSEPNAGKLSAAYLIINDNYRDPGGNKPVLLQLREINRLHIGSTWFYDLREQDCAGRDSRAHGLIADDASFKVQTSFIPSGKWFAKKWKQLVYCRRDSQSRRQCARDQHFRKALSAGYRTRRLLQLWRSPRRTTHLHTARTNAHYRYPGIPQSQQGTFQGRISGTHWPYPAHLASDRRANHPATIVDGIFPG